MTIGDTIRQLEQQFEQSDDPRERVDILLNLSAFYIHTDISVALQKAEDALICACAINYEKGMAESLYGRGRCRIFIHEYSDAMKDLLRSYRMFAKLGLELNCANVLNAVASIYKETGRYERALELLSRAVGIFTRSNDRKGLCHVLNTIGLVTRRIGRYDKALDAFLESLKIAEELGDLQAISKRLHNIAGVYQRILQFDRALDFLFRSLEIKRLLGNTHGEALTMRDIGVIYSVIDRTGEALQYLLCSAEIIEKMGLKKEQGAAMFHLGGAYEFRQEYAAAITCYRRALAFAVSTGDWQLRLQSLVFIGRCYTNSKQYDTAIPYLYAALAIPGTYLDQANAHGRLSLAYEHTGNLAEALEHYKHFADMKEKATGSQMQQTTAEIEARYESEKKEKEKEMYRMKSQQLEQETKHRIRELNSVALHLVHKNEVLEKVDSMLTDMLRTCTKGEVERLPVIVREARSYVRQNILVHKEWQQFEDRFGQVHHNFTRLLIERYPALSRTERRVCILVKAGLSSKEIAGFLFLSVRTVDRHRNSIRKKLGLAPNASLADALAVL